MSHLEPQVEASGAPQGITSHTPGHSLVAGRASGKRTLAEVMDHDMAVKRKKREETQREVHTRDARSSKFFDVRPPAWRDATKVCGEAVGCPVAGPSCITLDVDDDKENVPCADDDEVFTEDADAVVQEDGYISPSPSMRRWDSEEVSSPVRARPGQRCEEEDDDFGADILSSPPPARRVYRSISTTGAVSVPLYDGGTVLVPNTPSKSERKKQARERPEACSGPDLQDTFGDCNWDWDGGSSDIECSGELDPYPSTATSSGPVTPSNIPLQAEAEACAQKLEAEDVDEAMGSQDTAVRHARVARGWWERWGRGTRSPAVAQVNSPSTEQEVVAYEHVASHL